VFVCIWIILKKKCYYVLVCELVLQGFCLLFVGGCCCCCVGDFVFVVLENVFVVSFEFVVMYILVFVVEVIQ